MIAAHEVRAVSVGFGDERAGSVPADVVERAKGSVVLHDDDHAPTGELVRGVVAGSRNSRAERSQLPLRREDVRPLRGVEVRVQIGTGRERRRHSP